MTTFIIDEAFAMQCLGLDLGSSTIKGAVLDLDRDLIGATVNHPFPPSIAGLPPGWFEVSPAEVEREVRQVLTSLLSEAPDAEHLYVTGQMGGVVLTDGSGHPLSNYLSWRDQRTLSQRSNGVSYVDAVRQQWEVGVLESLGNELQPGSTTALLYWLDQHQLLPAQATPVTIADYIIGCLCGVPPRMHVTHAIGMLHLVTADWHREAFERLGLGGVQLPELSRQPEEIGQFKINGRTLRVFGAYGDQQCALLGAGLRQNELSINISTGSQVSLRTSVVVPGRYQTRSYFEGDWLNTITHLPAGRSLNVLFDLLTELAAAEGVTLKDPWDHVVRMATNARDTSLQVDLAFFAGPLGTTGSISQITTENLTVGSLFQAAFRAMVDNYSRCAKWLDPQQPWNFVVLSGGLTEKVPLLRELIQDRFSVPIRESTGDETMLGLLKLAKTCLD